jgi:hypothetical protein
MSYDEMLSRTNFCKIATLKVILIQLRRGNYKYWTHFKQIIEEYINDFINYLDQRWLLSIIDSYIDCGTEIESSNALLINSFYNHAKLRRSEHDLYSFNHILNTNKKSMTQYVFSNHKMTEILWDGGDDTLDNFFKRIEYKLKKTPILLKLFTTFMEINYSQESIWYNLSKQSENFKRGYIRFFEKH